VFLFKASGATYRRVIKQSKHAFPYAPRDVHEDEFVLLSKNREDCADTERQIQYVAKVLTVRAPVTGELDASFPGVNASSRFGSIVELYWSKPLAKPFNLSEVAHFNYRHYDTVQDFAQLHETDAQAIVDHLGSTNDQVLLDFLNNAVRP